MSDKLRAAALAALNMLNDYHDCLQAANILRVGLSEPAIKESLTGAEPVGKFSKFSDGVWKEVTASSPGIFLYTAPPRREWVGLTEDEIEYLRNDQPWWMVRDIEAKLKEKNT